MKLRFLSLMIILGLLVGCQNESDVKVSQGNCSILASIESAVDESRTAVDDAGNVTWIKTDAIGVFGSVTENAKFTSTGDGASVTFEGSLSVEGEEIACVYYPYDETASLQANELTFTLPAEYTYTGASCAPMLGVKNGNDGYKFKHLCGLMRVSIIGVPVGTSTFTLVSEGENAPSIAGTAVVNDIHATDATLELNGNLSHQITVTITSDEMTNATLYLPLPVGTYSKLSVTYKDETAEYFKKSTSNVTINRGTLLDMPVVASIDGYLEHINTYISSLEFFNFDNITVWLETQSYVSDVFRNDNRISILFENGMKCSIVFDDYNTYLAAEEEKSEPLTRSVGKEDVEKFLSSNAFYVPVEKTSYINKITNKNVLCYAPLNDIWCGFSFGALWGWKHENEIFEKIVSNSPISLNWSFSKAGIETIEKFKDYGIVLITKTHGGDQSSFAFNGYLNPKVKEDYEIVEYFYVRDILEQHAIVENTKIYTFVHPKFVKKHLNTDNKIILAAMYCDSQLMGNATNGNFIGTENLSTRQYNSELIKCYFTGLFNGLSHQASVDKCREYDSYLGTYFKHNDKFPDQRYFSIDTRVFRTVDGYMDVGAQILGWDNLKGKIDKKWTDEQIPIFKTDQLKYMVYYSNSPFESPAEAHVYSKQIGFYKADFKEGIVWEHYMPVSEDILQSQCRIKIHNYVTLGFEYIDSDGKRKIYYGDIKTSSGASAFSSRGINENDSSFMSFNTESLKCIDLNSIE